MIDAAYSNSQRFQYIYDEVGNRTAQTATITSTQGTNYVYDAANRLASVNGQAYSWDDNGNLVNDGTTVYAYDQVNRLISTTLGVTTTQFAYNGDGARLKQVVNGSAMTYTLDLAAPLVQVLMMQDASGKTAYEYGLMRIGEQQSAGWVYHLSDALGSVRQLAEGNGQITLARGYSPYGEPLWSQGNGQSVYGYTGENYDVSTGLVFLRARYMQPRLGTFLSRDPWSGDEMRPGSMNGWNYAEGNPANHVDPSGKWIIRSCIWPNHFEQDPKTGQQRCVSPFGIVIGGVDVGTLPATGDPASELAKWLAIMGISVCVDVVAEIIREQRYDPHVIVELGAGDYENAIAMKEKFPSANVFATNLKEEYVLGKFVDEKKLDYSPLFDHVLSVYRGFWKAKGRGVVVGVEQPNENKDIVQVLAGMADIVYTILPYPSSAMEFGYTAGILAKNQPGTMVFVSEAGSGSSNSFIQGFQFIRPFAEFGFGPGVPFFDLDDTKWEGDAILTRLYLQLQ